MTAPLDEDVVQHVNDAGTTAWSGLAYRFTNARRRQLTVNESITLNPASYEQLITQPPPDGQ